MRRTFFFIVTILFANESFASIPRASILDDAPAIDTPSAETRVWASDVLAPFERQAESELTRALRRAYEHAGTTNVSGLGRFLSVDPTWESADLTKPQSWNRYSYVLNNPVNMVDPDGKWGIIFDLLDGGTSLFEKGYDPEVSDNPPRTQAELDQRVSEGSARRLDGPVIPVVMGTRTTTPPTLPDKTIAKNGKVEIYHNYKSNDHGHAHAHVTGGGPDTRIGPNGKPAFKGDAPMTPAQRKVYEANKSSVRRAINKIGRWLKWMDTIL